VAGFPPPALGEVGSCAGGRGPGFPRLDLWRLVEHLRVVAAARGWAPDDAVRRWRGPSDQLLVRLCSATVWRFCSCGLVDECGGGVLRFLRGGSDE
jgi:hypothetical protein